MLCTAALAGLVTLTSAQTATTAPRSSPPANAPVVSTEWLQSHLNDPAVRVIVTGDQGLYDKAHIPGARFIDHMATLGDGHRLLPPDALAAALAKVGAADGAHVVLYGDSPMTTGWLFMAFASIGHAADVSMLDGGVTVWQEEGRATTTTVPAAGSGRLTPRPAPDVIVDAAWVRGKLESPQTRLLDVRTTREWTGGHLPGATLVLWQDLFADVPRLKFKTTDEMRALFAKAGVQPGQQVVTYCAIGMRASLMYWAARSVGLPARVYVGSWEDWQRDSSNPIVR
jgi:thiosulfate/3-mercaptopyruvate sulfurtransferase